MDINLIRIVVTVVAFVSFVAIVAWALKPGNRKGFDEAAMLPFDEEGS